MLRSIQRAQEDKLSVPYQRLDEQPEIENKSVRVEVREGSQQMSLRGLEAQKNKDNLTLEDIITPAKFYTGDQASILRAFNQNVKESAVSFSSFRGKRIQRDEYLLVHRNKTPELVPFNEQRIALPLLTAPGVVVEEIGVVKQAQSFYGAHGTYVLNVPVGKYAKAWSSFDGQVLLDSGTHVIHDPNFIFDRESGFVDKASAYIQHYNIHILRVPAGKIAKIWLGSEPRLLESRPEPYIFNTPYFELVKTQQGRIFEDASAKQIEHGSLKRLIPYTGEVAITYNNGKLQIIKEPTLINSPTHLVQGFLSTSVQTVVFPSDDTKLQRQKDGAVRDEIAYEVFTTKDSLKVGVKLMVAYAIKNPEITLAELGRVEDIIKHIENVATVDMGMVIQKSTAQEFLSSVQTKPRTAIVDEKQAGLPSAPESQTIQDEVRNKLKHDLAEYGIELVRLNFETPKILNAEIAQKMSQQSLVTAEVSAKEANMEKNAWIARTQAEQDAQVLSIQQKQRNSNVTAAAQAQAEALKIEADAKLEAAKREASAKLIIADAEQKAARMQGEVFNECPSLLELEKAKLYANAVQKAQLFVMNDDLRGLFMPSLNAGAGLTFFNPRDRSSAPILIPDAKRQNPEARVASLSDTVSRPS